MSKGEQTRQAILRAAVARFGRDGYRAFAAIWDDEHAAPCREAPDDSCADEVQVIEDV